MLIVAWTENAKASSTLYLNDPTLNPQLGSASPRTDAMKSRLAWAASAVDKLAKFVIEDRALMLKAKLSLRYGDTVMVKVRVFCIGSGVQRGVQAVWSSDPAERSSRSKV